MLGTIVALTAGCASRKPTYEYEPWITTTSTAEPVPPPVGAAAPPPAAVATPTSTTLPSSWRRGAPQ
jgi:hypothetical protein